MDKILKIFLGNEKNKETLWQTEEDRPDHSNRRTGRGYEQVWEGC